MKKMLPIIGVGSAAAFIGLVASRRSASSSRTASSGDTARRRPSGIVVRSPEEAPESVAPESSADLAGPLSLREFWDAAPESELLAEDMLLDGSLADSEPSDGDALTAEWLARATEAPMIDEAASSDADDPAEIAADSLSMISDASRQAATLPSDDLEATSERF